MLTKDASDREIIRAAREYYNQHSMAKQDSVVVPVVSQPEHTVWGDIRLDFKVHYATVYFTRGKAYHVSRSWE